MKTAVDTNILMDLLLDDPKYAASSTVLLRQAQQEGSLIVCEVVIAELHPALGSAAMNRFLDDLQLVFVPSSLQSAMLAGEMLSQYLTRRQSSGRVVADFLVGAHAKFHAERLLTRDRGYYRDYFKDLEVMGG